MATPPVLVGTCVGAIEPAVGLTHFRVRNDYTKACIYTRTCRHVRARDPLFLFGAAFSLVVLVGIQQHVLAGAVAKAQAVLLEQLDVPAGAP